VGGGGGTPVLRTNVIPLPVELRGVVMVPECVQQILIFHLFAVVHHLQQTITKPYKTLDPIIERPENLPSLRDSDVIKRVCTLGPQGTPISPRLSPALCTLRHFFRGHMQQSFVSG
jgi:hypothetical protein